MKWSRVVFLKIFGAVFLISINAWASKEEKALDAAKRAFLIQSGIKKEIDNRKKELGKKAKELLKEHNILEEAAVIGGILQIVRERGLKVKYKGVDYIVTPNQIKVIIYL